MKDLAFTGNPLDRASARRGDPAWLAAQLQAGRFLPFWQNKPLVVDEAAGLQTLGFLAASGWPPTATIVFLGLDGTQPLFAVDLGADEPAPELGRGAFLDMRAAAQILPGRDCAIAGMAKALLDWNGRHRFCPNCGHETGMLDGGTRRHCPNCGAEHFPRTDPVVIMLPILGDECLVGRNARFPDGLVSAFAGFVETGESLEEAVRRELKEEVGIAVGAVTYHASQPWPFPSSLMLGCYAQALSRDFVADGAEITMARWMTRDEARARLRDEIADETRLPSSIAIARRLIRDWVEK